MSGQDQLPGVRPEFQVTRNALAVRGRRSRVESAVVSIKPDPELWAYALEAAGGDPRRVEVVSPTDLRIHNRPRR